MTKKVKSARQPWERGVNARRAARNITLTAIKKQIARAKAGPLRRSVRENFKTLGLLG